MDPLSIAASIAGLLSLTGAVISQGYVICSRLKRRKQDVKQLMNEVTSFSGLLYGLREHLNTQSVDKDDSGVHPSSEKSPQSLDISWQDAIKDCEEILSQIRAFLDEISSENSLRLAVNREFITDRVKEFISRLDRYKTFFILGFQLNAR
jgi:hypothetical protein